MTIVHNWQLANVHNLHEKNPEKHKSADGFGILVSDGFGYDCPERTPDESAACGRAGTIPDNQTGNPPHHRMRKRFPLERAPLFTAIFCDGSAAALAQQAKAAWYAGADGVCVELRNLPRDERSPEKLRALIDASPLPTMCCLYRNDILDGTDDAARTKTLLAALNAGAACIDVMGDLFDPSPREWSRKPAAIAKQKRLIAKIHEAGAQAIISSHPLCYLPPEEVLAQLKDFEKRGADIVKLVQKADTEEEFLGALRATFLCRRELKTPFVHLVSGAFGDLHRLLAPRLGVALTFATLDKRGAFPMPQPPLANFKAVFENIRFQMP